MSFLELNGNVFAFSRNVGNINLTSLLFVWQSKHTVIQKAKDVMEIQINSFHIHRKTKTEQKKWG